MTNPAPTSAERAEKLQGMGCKRKRVEDIRFIQGKGSYVDDLKLPGMLYGDFTRSPHAHARIKTIDASKAKAVPGVLAVLTAADLKPLNLHYMPTLAGDVQAVLAEDKVLYQNQEVAFVVADDRYTAADGADLVEVAYEGLPCNVDSSRRWRRMLPCCARISRARPRARTARASTTTTSSPGR
jgi:carbon-monoxide dehydrogenase large subunit